MGKTYGPSECASIDEAFAPDSMWRAIDLVPDEKMRLNDKETADICFQVDGQQIWAHKKVLTKSLDYFDAMFQQHWVECDKRDFTVYDFTYNTF